MSNVEELPAIAQPRTDASASVQSAGFLLELSPDWLILRASENAHGLLGEYHQRLAGEPLADFMLAQPLHDLRNSLSRQRSSSGIARAYRVRLVDEPRYFDVAFQALGSTILFEGLPSADEGYGEALGSVSRLIDGLSGGNRAEIMEGAARRMRALTGFDRVILTLGTESVESSRGRLPQLEVTGELPAIVIDASAKPVGLFPTTPGEPVGEALLRSPSLKQLDELRSAGIRSALRVPVVRDGKTLGQFQCDNRALRSPSFELHAAAELFAQIFGMLLPK
jgi:light-regulated signal transduction histidine kinase (bacteriophytochrome)